jgi:hypothetical protein
MIFNIHYLHVLCNDYMYAWRSISSSDRHSTHYHTLVHYEAIICLKSHTNHHSPDTPSSIAFAKTSSVLSLTPTAASRSSLAKASCLASGLGSWNNARMGSTISSGKSRREARTNAVLHEKLTKNSCILLNPEFAASPVLKEFVFS